MDPRGGEVIQQDQPKPDLHHTNKTVRHRKSTLFIQKTPKKVFFPFFKVTNFEIKNFRIRLDSFFSKAGNRERLEPSQGPRGFLESCFQSEKSMTLNELQLR